MELPPARDQRPIEDLARRARRAAAATSTRYPPCWDALAAGELPAAEVARLRAEAAVSNRGRAAFEVFRPLDAGFRARMVEQVLALLRPSTRRRPAGVLAFLKAHRGWPRLAAVAAVALSLYWLGHDAGRHRAPPAGLAAASLPLYELTVTGVAARRSASIAPEIPTLAAGTSCTLVLSPATPAAGPVGGRFYAVRGELWKRWRVELEVASSGALRVRGPIIDDLSLEPGSWLLVAAVGRPQALPSVPELRAALASGRGAPPDGGWQLAEKPVVVEP